ncbi:conserved hypothetical protein [Ricinus communis]|uniref:Uncharacterized protein n=1 Tax=Ricinus communis TaxID=3988 RepID=B9SUN4_RICCO|nr:conserved hypothetical protein [Ricinus communis]
MPLEEGVVEKVGDNIPSPEYGGSKKTPLRSSVTWDETTRLPESTASKGHLSYFLLGLLPPYQITQLPNRYVIKGPPLLPIEPKGWSGRRGRVRLELLAKLERGIQNLRKRLERKQLG